jgi:hypothetical protein
MSASVQRAESTRRIGSHCAPHILAKLDGRTREARLMREARAELTAHVGGKPSATQRALIEQAAQLRLRIATMDRRYAETGEMTAHDSRTYLAWANSYSRLLRQLGLKGAPAPVMTLAEHLAARHAAQAPTAAPITPAAQRRQPHPPQRMTAPKPFPKGT